MKKTILIGFAAQLTGVQALPEDIKKAFEAGFDRHLAKPVELTTLEQMLAQAQVNFNVIPILSHLEDVERHG